MNVEKHRRAGGDLHVAWTLEFDAVPVPDHTRSFGRFDLAVEPERFAQLHVESSQTALELRGFASRLLLLLLFIIISSSSSSSSSSVRQIAPLLRDSLPVLLFSAPTTVVCDSLTLIAFVRSLTHSLTRSFVRSFVHSFIHSFIHMYVCALRTSTWPDQTHTSSYQLRQLHSENNGSPALPSEFQRTVAERRRLASNLWSQPPQPPD